MRATSPFDEGFNQTPVYEQNFWKKRLKSQIEKKENAGEIAISN
jgi:hypothetical protein